MLNTVSPLFKSSLGDVDLNNKLKKILKRQHLTIILLIWDHRTLSVGKPWIMENLFLTAESSSAHTHIELFTHCVLMHLCIIFK
jgi:hypothetical protein